MQHFTGEQVDEVIHKMALAADRNTLFITNTFARTGLTKEKAVEILNATPRERVSIAEQLLLTKTSEEAAMRTHGIPKRGVGSEPWMQGTNDLSRRAIIAKLRPYVGKYGPGWCNGKLRLSGIAGLGVRIEQADDADMRVIAAYLLKLKPTNVDTVRLPERDA
ncbi:hypothetical protein CBS101457_000302 [Exobasidium rhododendri]|nr:hypothetical protein CBS101457_000302 [Exobasidium rhododendri]